MSPPLPLPPSSSLSGMAPRPPLSSSSRHPQSHSHSQSRNQPQVVVKTNEINLLIYSYLSDTFPASARQFKEEAGLESLGNGIGMEVEVVGQNGGNGIAAGMNGGGSRGVGKIPRGLTPTIIQLARSAAAAASASTSTTTSTNNNNNNSKGKGNDRSRSSQQQQDQDVDMDGEGDDDTADDPPYKSSQRNPRSNPSGSYSIPTTPNGNSNININPMETTQLNHNNNNNNNNNNDPSSSSAAGSSFLAVPTGNPPANSHPRPTRGSTRLPSSRTQPNYTETTEYDASPSAGGNTINNTSLGQGMDGGLGLGSGEEQMHKRRKKDLIKLLQEGLVYRGVVLHTKLGGKGMQCTTPLHLLEPHICSFTSTSTNNSLITPFRQDLLRPLSPPKTKEDRLMEEGRRHDSDNREDADNGAEDGIVVDVKGKGKEREDPKGMISKSTQTGSLIEGSGRGKDSDGYRQPAIPIVTVGDSSSAVEEGEGEEQEEEGEGEGEGEGEVPGPSTTKRSHKKKIKVRKDFKNEGKTMQVDRQSSNGTTGTGKSGNSGGGVGGTGNQKGGYRVPRVMSPLEGEDDEVEEDGMDVDEDMEEEIVSDVTGGSKKRKAGAGVGIGRATISKATTRKSSDTPSDSNPSGGTGSGRSLKKLKFTSKQRKPSPAQSKSTSNATSEYGGGKSKTDEEASVGGAEVVVNPLKPAGRENLTGGEVEGRGEEGALVKLWKVRWHARELSYVAWNPVNTKCLVTGGSDPTCCIWEFGPAEGGDKGGEIDGDEKGRDELEQLAKLPLLCRAVGVAKNKGMTQVMWNEDGNLIVSGCADGNVRGFSAGADFLGIHARHNGNLTAVAINRPGNMAVSAGEDKVLSTWHTGTGTSRDIDSYHSAFITDIAFYDDEIFATCSEDAEIKFHSTNKLGLKGNLLGHTGMINMIKFSPVGKDGKSVGPEGTRRLLASCSDDKSIRVWDVEDLSGNGGDKSKVKVEDGMGGLGQSSLGKGSFAVKKLQGHTDCVSLVAWCPVVRENGQRLLASASWANNLSKTDSENRNVIRVFDVLSGDSLYCLTAHTSRIQKIQFEPTKGDCFVSCSDDGKMIIWETMTGKELRVYETDCSINDVDWRSDGQQLAMAAEDGTLRTMYVGDLVK